MNNGTYNARVVGALLGETRSGKDQLELLWEVIDGPEEGAQISSQHYFSGGAKPITLEVMQHLGWTAGADLDSIRGTCKISVYSEEYQGEIRQKVRVLTPRSGGFQTPDNKRKSPAAAKSFLARLTGGSSGDAFDDGPPPMPGDDAKPGSDDLPF